MPTPKRRKPKVDRYARVKARVASALEPLDPEARKRVIARLGRQYDEPMTIAETREALGELESKGLVERNADDPDRWRLTPEAREHERVRALRADLAAAEQELAEVKRKRDNIDTTIVVIHPDDVDKPLEQQRVQIGRHDEEGRLVGNSEWYEPTEAGTKTMTFLITEGVIARDPARPDRYIATEKARVLPLGPYPGLPFPSWHGAMEPQFMKEELAP